MIPKSVTLRFSTHHSTFATGIISFEYRILKSLVQYPIVGKDHYLPSGNFSCSSSDRCQRHFCDVRDGNSLSPQSASATDGKPG